MCLAVGTMGQMGGDSWQSLKARWWGHRRPGEIPDKKTDRRLQFALSFVVASKQRHSEA